MPAQLVARPQRLRGQGRRGPCPIRPTPEAPGRPAGQRGLAALAEMTKAPGKPAAAAVAQGRGRWTDTETRRGSRGGACPPSRHGRRGLDKYDRCLSPQYET